MYLRPVKQNLAELVADLREMLGDIYYYARHKNLEKTAEKTKDYWEYLDFAHGQLNDQIRNLEEQFPEALPFWIKELSQKTRHERNR